jgi:tetratricopeptide (TPR) repeat protein
MTTEALLGSVERSSRISAVLMILGGIVVLGALWSATSRLNAVRSEVAGLVQEVARLGQTRGELDAQVKESRAQIATLRQALAASRDAIAAFHARNYAAAVDLYDSALNADPENSYLENLRAYALFKLGKVQEAVQSQAKSLERDPAYAWGYFDLARFQCAAGDRSAARKSFDLAQQKEARFKDLAVQDGEFRRLCGDLGGH